MKLEDLPFDRGTFKAYYTDDLNQTIDTVYEKGKEYEGREFLCEDVNKDGTQVSPARSGKLVRVRIVRNVAATVLLPKRAAKFKTDGSTADVLGGRVDGYAESHGVKGGIVDEYLPSGGVPIGALFYIVVDGPTEWTSGASGDTNIGIGGAMVPTTDGKWVERDAVTVAVAGNSEANIETAITYALAATEGLKAFASVAVNAINTATRCLVNRV